jgi:hypothetical protein
MPIGDTGGNGVIEMHSLRKLSSKPRRMARTSPARETQLSRMNFPQKSDFPD